MKDTGFVLVVIINSGRNMNIRKFFKSAPVYHKSNTEMPFCSHCDILLLPDVDYPQCTICGQKIDWSAHVERQRSDELAATET